MTVHYVLLKKEALYHDPLKELVFSDLYMLCENWQTKSPNKQMMIPVKKKQNETKQNKTTNKQTKNTKNINFDGQFYFSTQKLI